MFSIYCNIPSYHFPLASRLIEGSRSVEERNIVRNNISRFKKTSFIIRFMSTLT